MQRPESVHSNLSPFVEIDARIHPYERGINTWWKDGSKTNVSSVTAKVVAVTSVDWKIMSTA